MRLSKYLLPVLKETPAEAKIISHQYMLRAGMIRQLSSGIYNWLPLGLRVLKNIENIIREEMDKSGALELLMPTMQPAKLWKESGRDDYGKETLKAKDRHGNELIYGPTNEEVITDLFRNSVKSYKELPLNLYHMQWKFRDEIRPRFGIMRGREFYMKDAYSFDIDEESAIKSYDIMYKTYFSIFNRLGLKVIPFKADTGSIGGDMSHEFQVIASTGESEIFYDPEFENLISGDALTDDKIDIDKLKSLYSATDEMHNPNNAPKNIKTARGIEVGHIFYLGDKYTKAMNVTVQNKEGKRIYPKMGCYGIGISRIVGAIIEASHDDKGIRWPDSVAPFKVGLINLKIENEKCSSICEEIYSKLESKKIDVLYDDRKESAGSKFATMELIGLPWQITVGPRSAQNRNVEIKNRKTGEKVEMSINDAIRTCSEYL